MLRRGNIMNINKVIGYLSIRYKLIVVFLSVSFIPLIVVGTYGLTILSTGLSTMADKHVEDEVFTIARLMDSFLTTVQHGLSHLSRNIQYSVEIPSTREGKAKWTNQLRSSFYSFLIQYEGYRRISYFDETGSEKIRAEIRDGKIEFAFPESLRSLSETLSQDSKRLNPGETYICCTRLKEEPIVRFSTPILDKNGLKKGILVADFLMADFYRFAGKTHPPSKGLTILINNQGDYLYHPLKAGGRLSDDYPTRVVSGILSNPEGGIEEIDEEIIGYAPITNKIGKEGERWIVVHVLPKDDVLSPLKGLRTFFLEVMGLTFIGVFIIGFFATRHFTKPIEELRNGVSSIAHGNLNHRLDIQTNDEIELLANDFNHMAQAISELEERLKVYASGLERMVEERTKEIEREKQKLDNIVRGIGTALALIDREMRILWHNDIFEEWFGKIDTSQGIKCYETCRRLDSPCSECPGVKTFHSGGIEQMEQVITTRTGEKRFFQYITGPIRDNGNVAQVLIMIQDITEKKRLEAQIIHREKMAAFGLLAAGIAHEIGNPLTSLSSLVQYAQRKSHSEPTQEMLSVMRSQIDRIANIVREMVDFAHPPTYERCPTQVNDVIQSAIGIAKYDPRGKEVYVKAFLDPEIPPIVLVPDQLLQVCLNIILNAFDAMGSGGELIITSKQVEKRIEISFRDNGPGMSEEIMEHVFEPFFTTKEAGKGTGLGLSVSYGIIKNFGGEILIKSRLGEGTTFTVVLPIGGYRDGGTHTNSR